jgi:DNA mismatch endonuclease (patch repair protein)
LPYLRCEADVVFPKIRLAVFLDGCFWHGCPEHATRPVAHGEWWGRKLDRNKVRDEQNGERLRQAGWTVLRIWVHESQQTAVARIKALVGELKETSSRAMRQ